MRNKIVTIGDLHGKDRAWWGEPIDKLLNGEYEKAIFLGDYVDCFFTPNIKIKENLEDIIELKKNNPDKIELLWGNHEGNYAWTSPNMNNPYSCSGYRGDMHMDLYDLFRENFNLFQLAYQCENYLWTHAGIHEGWWDYEYPYAKKELSDIAEGINAACLERNESIFQVGWYRGGSYPVGGPLWVDRKFTSKKPLKGLHQIVGHSKVDNITKITIDKNTSITFCDCLDKNTEFHVIEI